MQYKIKDPNLLDDVFDTLLRNRGVPKEEWKDYVKFADNIEDEIQNPLDLSNMQAAVEIATDYLWDHSLSPLTKVVAIPIHNDTDSMCAAAVLTNFFHSIDRTFEPRLVFHKGKADGLQRIIDKNIENLSLVICPDAGSDNQKEWDWFTKNNIPVICLDHHETLTPCENDFITIVNCQLSPDYRNKFLCGTGMVWQFCRAFAAHNNIGWDPLEQISLVALATVADKMALKQKENRAIVDFGRNNLYNGFITTFMNANEYSIKGEFSPEKIEYYFAPALNAVARISDLEEMALIYSSLLDCNAEKMVPSGSTKKKGEQVYLLDEAVRVSTNAKSRQKTRIDHLIDKTEGKRAGSGILPYIFRYEFQKKHKCLIIPIDDMAPKDYVLTGLIANKLIDKFKLPAIVVYPADDEYKGSMRCPRIETHPNFKDIINDSDFALCSGHQLAAGISIPFDLIDDLQEYLDKQLKDYTPVEFYEVDYIFNNVKEAKDVIDEMNLYKLLWGNDLPFPMICLEKVRVQEINPMSVGIKFTLANGFTAIDFKMTKEEAASLSNSIDCDENVFTFIGKPQENIYYTKSQTQIMLSSWDIEPAEFTF